MRQSSASALILVKIRDDMVEVFLKTLAFLSHQISQQTSMRSDDKDLLRCQDPLVSVFIASRRGRKEPVLRSILRNKQEINKERKLEIRVFDYAWSSQPPHLPFISKSRSKRFTVLPKGLSITHK